MVFQPPMFLSRFNKITKNTIWEIPMVLTKCQHLKNSNATIPVTLVNPQTVQIFLDCKMGDFVGL